MMNPDPRLLNAALVGYIALELAVIFYVIVLASLALLTRRHDGQ